MDIFFCYSNPQTCFIPKGVSTPQGFYPGTLLSCFPSIQADRRGTGIRNEVEILRKNHGGKFSSTSRYTLDTVRDASEGHC